MLECDPSKVLTKKELNFFVECCVYNSQGGDLTNFGALWDHFDNLKFFKKKNDLSTYKKKLGEKKWIRGKRGVFILPKAIDIIDKGTHFLVLKEDQRVKTNVLKFTCEYEFFAGDREDYKRED